ncbi:MAG TPA: PD-(D/E)XK nuclease family protein [Candidatus Obscuribacterales bacterium]
MEIVSFSALADFWACPRLYHYRQEQHLPVPQHHTAARREGSWIHQQLDLHAKGHLPPIATDPAYAGIWQSYLDVISPYADAGWSCFSEWSCHVPLRLDAEQIWLHGRMDRIYVQNQTLVLLDFKTGRDQPGLLSELQLDFYAWLLWQVQDLLSEQTIGLIEARAVWLAQPGQVMERRLDAAAVPEHGAGFMALLEALLGAGNRDVPAPRSVAGQPWCTMCEYQRLCPEGSFYAQ